MAIRCPNCQRKVDESGWCGTTDCLRPMHGVWRLMTKEFFQKLDLYLASFQLMRDKEGLRITDSRLYEGMPYGDNYPRAFKNTWKEFRQDLDWLQKRMNGYRLKVLNYGSWNGWLSNRLVAWGHEVTAVSYFIDPFDGLGAKQHFSNDWLAIQMNIEELSTLEKTFDVIIMNRGISFLMEPLKRIRDLQTKLTNGGRLFITGLHIFDDPAQREAHLATRAGRYKSDYDLELFPFPTKGYLDQSDEKAMLQMGIGLTPGRSAITHMVNRLLPTRPRYYYGYFEK